MNELKLLVGAIGDASDPPIGNVAAVAAAGGGGLGVAGTGVYSLVKGIKEIVSVVLKDNEGHLGATKTA